MIIYFIESLKMKLGLDNDYYIERGYETGCLGYTLYHQFINAEIKCVILAPTTMLTQQGKRVKYEKYNLQFELALSELFIIAFLSFYSLNNKSPELLPWTLSTLLAPPIK